MPQLGHGPGGGLGFRHRRAQWPSLLYLKQDPGGFLFLLVDGGLEPCRAVAKRWYLAQSHWAFSSFASSSWLLKTLQAKFKRSRWGVWRLSSAFFSFFRISGDDWEIKWVLRTMVPSAEVGSNFIYLCSTSFNLARNYAGFSSSLWVLSQSLSKFMALCPASWRPTMRQAIIWLLAACPGLPAWFGIISGDSHCPYGLSVLCPVYLISMGLRGLPYSFLLFWEKSRGKYDVNIMPG